MFGSNKSTLKLKGQSKMEMVKVFDYMGIGVVWFMILCIPLLFIVSIIKLSYGLFSEDKMSDERVGDLFCNGILIIGGNCLYMLPVALTFEQTSRTFWIITLGFSLIYGLLFCFIELMRLFFFYSDKLKKIGTIESPIISEDKKLIFYLLFLSSFFSGSLGNLLAIYLSVLFQNVILGVIVNISFIVVYFVVFAVMLVMLMVFLLYHPSSNLKEKRLAANERYNIYKEAQKIKSAVMGGTYFVFVRRDFNLDQSEESDRE